MLPCIKVLHLVAHLPRLEYVLYLGLWTVSVFFHDVLNGAEAGVRDVSLSWRGVCLLRNWPSGSCNRNLNRARQFYASNSSLSEINWGTTPDGVKTGESMKARSVAPSCFLSSLSNGLPVKKLGFSLAYI